MPDILLAILAVPVTFFLSFGYLLIAEKIAYRLEKYLHPIPLFFISYGYPYIFLAIFALFI